MEIVIPAAAGDFHFDSTSSSPFISAPTSPKGFGDCYFSAPTSPSRASAIYAEFTSSLSSIPFHWEEKPGTPKSTAPNNNNNNAFGVTDHENEDEDADDDFAFDFSGQLEKPPLTAAEELFDGGKIRPLKPPPRLQSPVSSPKSPKRTFRNAFSPKAKKEFDPFAAALEETRKGSIRERGREREPATNPSQRAARSHSPFRVSEPKPEIPSSSALKSGNNSKKWRLKDFLLFRSASEGSSTDKDPLRKYRLLPPKKGREDVKNASFRSTDSGGSVSRSSRRGDRVSAHELHYTANRAVSEEQRKKTFLPYKQGLLGCIGFNPTAHGIAKGFHSFTHA